MRNIIIFGPAGAGKTTVAKMIKEMEPETVILSLGSQIKQICRDLKYDDKTNRELQQGVGQGMRGIFGDRVWCEYLHDRHRAMINSIASVAVIDDGRQMSELEYWVDKGFYPLGVVADADIRARRLLNRDGYDQANRFKNETEVSADMIAHRRCAATIRNERSLVELENTVDRFLVGLKNV